MHEDTYDEKSCGAVVYCRRGGEILYLVVQSAAGHWGFPKGHVENDETEYETAVREIREETGLTVEFIDGFRETDAYPMHREGLPDSRKQVVLYLARYDGREAKPEDPDIARAVLMDYDAAHAALRYEGSKRILADAHRFIQENL